MKFSLKCFTKRSNFPLLCKDFRYVKKPVGNGCLRLPRGESRQFFCMTGMSQVRGENPQEAPSAGELQSDLQVSDREVWERRSNSESVA